MKLAAEANPIAPTSVQPKAGLTSSLKSLATLIFL
jgi:hypothetical protein